MNQPRSLETQLQIQHLDATHIPEVIRLSQRIFGEDNTYHATPTWIKHFNRSGILLGAYVNNKIVGYKFGYQENKNTFHSWMGGVDKDYRRLCIATKLLKHQEQVVRDLDYQFITVNTSRHRYPAMYHLLLKQGYQIYKEEPRKWDNGTYIKSFFKKKL